MKIVFLGTPDFAVKSLTLLAGKYEVAAAVCQPDREKDRKGNFVVGAVKSAAINLNIPVFQFEKIRVDGVDTLKSLAPDLMVTCAYGQILYQEILDIPRLGVLNVHGSVLPKYRGSARIQRALINGEKLTGVTIMKTDIGMDSGDILAFSEIEIGENDYVNDLYVKLSELGANLLMETIEEYVSGRITPVKQDFSLVTYAPMLKKEEAFIDFSQSATNIRNKIRGFGYGVCSLYDQPLKIYRAEVVPFELFAKAGEVLVALKGEFIVQCGSGALKITELQQSGKKRMETSEFLNGVNITSGEILSNGNGGKV